MPFFNKKKNKTAKPSKSAAENNNEKKGKSFKPPKFSLKVLKEAALETGADLVDLLPDVSKTAGSAANTLYKGGQAVTKTAASGFTGAGSFIQDKLGNTEKAENLKNLTELLQTSAYNNLDEASESLVKTGQHASNAGAKLINEDAVYSESKIENTGGLVHLMDDDFQRNESANVEFNNIANEYIDKGVQTLAQKTGLDDGYEHDSTAYKVIEKVLNEKEKTQESLKVSHDFIEKKGLGVLNKVTETIVETVITNPASSINESLDNKDYLGAVEELAESADFTSISSRVVNGAASGVTQDLVEQGFLSAEQKGKIDSISNIAIEAAITYDEFKKNKEAANSKGESDSDSEGSDHFSTSSQKAKEKGLPDSPPGSFYSTDSKGNLYSRRNKKIDSSGNEIPKYDIVGNKLLNTKTNKFYKPHSGSISPKEKLSFGFKFATQNLLKPKNSNDHEGLSFFEKIELKKEDPLLYQAKSIKRILKIVKETKNIK